MASIRSEPRVVAPERTVLSHRQILVIFSGLMLGMFLAALDGTIVATALPTITGELGGLSHLSWVVTSYLLATTISTPIYGKLGDLYGRKRLFQAAIIVFLIGSALCGASQNMLQLILFRAVQGLGGGGLIVLAQAIIADVVSPRERGRYQGYFGAVFGASSVIGPLLGGFITDNLSWRWVFYVNIPIGLIALVVTSAVLPRAVRRPDVSIDVMGATILTVAVSALVLLTTWGGVDYAWMSPETISLGALVLLMLALLFVVERRAKEPIIPIHLFSMRTFNIATSASFIVGVAMFGAISFLPLFLQIVTGASATNSGLLLLPLMAGMLIASSSAGQIISRTGRYKLFPVVGLSMVAVAMFLMSTMGSTTTQSTVSVYMAILGCGFGFGMQPLVLATQNEVLPGDIGVATSSVNFFRSMGGSIGVALFGALFNSGLTSRLSSLSSVVGDPAALTPESVRALPSSVSTSVVAAFADSLTTVFLVTVPLVVGAVVLVSLLKEVTLRDDAPEIVTFKPPDTASDKSRVLRQLSDAG